MPKKRDTGDELEAVTLGWEGDRLLVRVDLPAPFEGHSATLDRAAVRIRTFEDLQSGMFTRLKAALLSVLVSVDHQDYAGGIDEDDISDMDEDQFGAFVKALQAMVTVPKGSKTSS